LWDTLSQVIKEYAPVVSHHQSKSLPVTKSLNELKRNCFKCYAVLPIYAHTKAHYTGGIG